MKFRREYTPPQNYNDDSRAYGAYFGQGKKLLLVIDYLPLKNTFQSWLHFLVGIYFLFPHKS